MTVGPPEPGKAPCSCPHAPSGSQRPGGTLAAPGEGGGTRPGAGRGSQALPCLLTHLTSSTRHGCRMLEQVGRQAQRLEATGLTHGHAKTQGQSSQGDVGISSVPFGAASTGPPGCFSAPDGAAMAARTPVVPSTRRGNRPLGPALQPIPRAPRSPLLPLMQSLPLSSSYLGSPRRAARPLTIPERSVGGPRWH